MLVWFIKNYIRHYIVAVKAILRNFNSLFQLYH